MHPLLIFLLSCVANAAPMTVIVDPGHGGVDHGAIRSETREADITLAVSRKLYALLTQDRRFHAYLTRENDRSISLNDRAKLAKTKKADLFVSIHVNSNPDNKAHGAEFYFQNQLPPDEESMLLAHQENSEDAGSGPVPYDFLEKTSYPSEVDSIVADLLDNDRVMRSSQLSKTLKLEWRGSKKSKNNSVRQAPFYVLSRITTPSTLVELGFLTNPSDLKELTNPQAQKRMAEDLYRGLIAYKESMDKSR
jgi:N-acetylmuramoyl-L-alanine amidase